MTSPLSIAEREALGQIALEVATEASQIVMQGYRAALSVSEKGRADLVTQYDVASECLIKERLRERAPEIAVIGEESGGQEREGRAFYVDPIDGTTNFVHGHPFFCVCIGLYEDGQATLGAVVAPVLGTSWLGVVGVGAKRLDSARVLARDARPCRVSATPLLADSLIATGFHPKGRGKPPADNLAAHARVMHRCRDIRRCGSAALDLCFVADGTYDAYWERLLMPWDAIGGAAIVLAAGGRITDLRGGAPDLRIGHIVASNGHIHEELIDVLAEANSIQAG